MGSAGNYKDRNSNKSEARLQTLIQELQVHQVELEVQNEELRLSKNNAEILNNKYSYLFDFAPSPYLTINRKSEILELNLKASELLGADRSVLQRQNFLKFIPETSYDLYNEFLESVFCSNLTKSIEIRLILTPDKSITVLLSCHVNPHEKQCLINIVDLTRRKELENGLLRAKEIAEEHNRLKTAFLQNISHEIRTPMNAIKGFSDLLAGSDNNPSKIQKYTRIINERCNDLLDIINDILDIARIESGQLTVYQENCDVNLLFQDLNSYFIDYQKKNDKHHIQFTISADQKEHLVIVTDKTKLKQLLVNLLTNAFKFTNEGKIEAGYKIENSSVIFYVSDSGIGIPVEKQHEIFERFVQLKADAAQTINGTGLGLAIVKGILQLLHGELHLISKPGEGSTFSFSIPLDQTISMPLERTSIKAQEISASQDHILIVEDDELNTEYIKEILSKTNMDVNYARNGKEAIHMALSGSVDLVLLDIGLPDMSGYDAMNQIRQIKPQIKFIAQTAYAAREDYHKAMAEGCVDYICKPFNQHNFLAVINRNLSLTK